MTAPSLTFDQPPPSWWRLGPALWLAAAVLLVLLYLVVNIPGSWFGGGAPQIFAGSSMTVLTGSAQADAGKLVVTGTDTRNAVILGLNTPHIPTQQYGMISLDVEGVPDSAEVTLFWRNDLSPNKMYTRSLTAAGGRVQDVMVAGDTNWLGRIHTIGLILQGTLASPVTINGVTVKPASAASVLADRWRDWTDQETWSGISLTRVIGGRSGTELPLPLITALAVALACVGYFALRRWKRWTGSALTIAAIVLTGWMVLDLRWQLNLFNDATTSWNDFAGRDLPAKRLMGVDSELEKIAVDIRPQVTPQSRLFIFAGDPGVAGRLGYLMLPSRVYYDITQTGPPAADKFKPGDLILFHRKHGVRYSPDRKELLWDAGFRLRGELVYAKRGAQLVKVIG